MDPTNRTYKRQFSDDAKAREYDAEQYGPSSYGEALWRVEQAQLVTLLEDFRRTHARVDYLDFACGTGRVISFLESQVDTATGIEISPSMASIARRRVGKAVIHCRDITEPSTVIEAQYDLITAFRFFLNAEPTLRIAALRALVSRLRDRTSWIVFNNHGNFWSHKVFLWPVHAVRNVGRYRTAGNYMTHDQVVALATKAGLQIEKVLGCGLIGAKLARFMDFDRVADRERKYAEGKLARLGVNQMYVARLK